MLEKKKKEKKKRSIGVTMMTSVSQTLVPMERDSKLILNYTIHRHV
jgi:hypothetical protein